MTGFVDHKASSGGNKGGRRGGLLHRNGRWSDPSSSFINGGCRQGKRVGLGAPKGYGASRGEDDRVQLRDQGSHIRFQGQWWWWQEGEEETAT